MTFFDIFNENIQNSNLFFPLWLLNYQKTKENNLPSLRKIKRKKKFEKSSNNTRSKASKFIMSKRFITEKWFHPVCHLQKIFTITVLLFFFFSPFILLFYLSQTSLLSLIELWWWIINWVELVGWVVDRLVVVWLVGSDLVRA